MLREMGKPLDSVVLLEVDYGELARAFRAPQLPGLRQGVSTCSRRLPRPESCARRRMTRTGSFQRTDDNEAAVAERLRVYDEKTKPLVEFYSQQGLLRSIQAEGEVDDITNRLNAVLHVADGARRRAGPAPGALRAAVAAPRIGRPVLRARLASAGVAWSRRKRP